MRLARPLSAALLSLTLVVACTSADAGWTYAPAPSKAPAPSGSAGASAEPSGSADPGVVMISALGIKFEQATVTVTAGQPFQIQFENKDPGVPHNVAIHTGGATGPEIFKGEIFNGIETRPYDVMALDAGAYAFVCTVHPTMVGTLNAE